LSWFHGANHLSQVPWREVEGHYSPGCVSAVAAAADAATASAAKENERLSPDQEVGRTEDD